MSEKGGFINLRKRFGKKSLGLRAGPGRRRQETGRTKGSEGQTQGKKKRILSELVQRIQAGESENRHKKKKNTKGKRYG